MAMNELSTSSSPSSSSSSDAENDNNFLFQDDDDGEFVFGGGSGDGDEGLTAKEIMAKWMKRVESVSVTERKSATQGLQDVFRLACTKEEDVATLLDVIEKLVYDKDQTIRYAVMEQLPHVAFVCQEEDNLSIAMNEILTEHILPHTVKLLTDKFLQVRKSAQSGFLLLAERELITPNQLEEFIVPIIMEFTAPSAHEDYRTEMTQFMSKLAPHMGKDIIIRTYLDRFCRLCYDKLLQIRRECASSIGEIAAVVGSHVTEKVLVKHFRSLSNDGVWGVRKGCAETITLFSAYCEPSVRKDVLTTILVTLLQDSSRWVRIAACQSLGPFITTFSGKELVHSSAECSEIEQTFLSTYNSENYYFPEESENSLAENRSTSKEMTVVPRFPLVKQINAMFVSFGEEGTVDQNQNKDSAHVKNKNALDTSSDFTVIPMEIDDDSEQNEVLDTSFNESDSEIVANDGSSSPSKDEVFANAEDEEEVNCNQVEESSKLCKANTTDSVDDKNSNGELQNLNLLCNKIMLSELDSNGSLPSTVILSEQSSATGSTDASNVEYNTWLYWREPFPDIDLNLVIPKPPEKEFIVPIPPRRVTSEHRLNVGGDSTYADPETSRQESMSFAQSEIHRSYMNLFNATTREDRIGSMSFRESMRLCENFDDEDSDDPLSASFTMDEFSSSLWDSRHGRPRLLVDLPKDSTYEQNIVPAVLLEHFNLLCQQNSDNQLIDSEILSFCVYNFPAVVLTLGSENWPLIRDCYEALACNMQWKTRFTLASSLHEIAKILGPELTERDLVPFYLATTKDVDEVRIGILRNLSEFVELLGIDSRKKCLETLNRFAATENARNWRFRLEFAEQLQKLLKLFSAEEIFKYFCPLCMDLLMDRVSEVRSTALNVIPYIIGKLEGNRDARSQEPLIPCQEDQFHEFLQLLVVSLGHNNSWIRRQAYASLAGLLCDTHAMPPFEFVRHMLPTLVDLSKDNVPNVRLKVAQSLVQYIIPQEYFADPSNPEHQTVLDVLAQLQEDKDRDVQFCSRPEDDGCLVEVQ